jgi:hypothetical protein
LFQDKFLDVEITSDLDNGKYHARVAATDSSSYTVGEAMFVWDSDVGDAWKLILDNVPKVPYNSYCSCDRLSLFRNGCNCVRPACTCSAFDIYHFGCKCGHSKKENLNDYDPIKLDYFSGWLP